MKVEQSLLVIKFLNIISKNFGYLDFFFKVTGRLQAWMPHLIVVERVFENY